MNIANKLQQIINIKTKIRNAIISKGIDVDKLTPFKEYPDKIRQIETGQLTKICCLVNNDLLNKAIIGESGYCEEVKSNG